MLAARIVTAVVTLGACLAQPVIAGDENPQAAIRTFALRIAQRRVPPAQRVLRATEGGPRQRHGALLHVEIHPR